MARKDAGEEDGERRRRWGDEKEMGRGEGDGEAGGRTKEASRMEGENIRIRGGGGRRADAKGEGK